MLERFIIKQHDLKPDLQVRLLSGTDPVDLTPAVSARLLMTNRQTGAPLGGAAVIEDQTVPANHGLVRYPWQDGDTAVAGDYIAEVEVTWPGNKAQTFPADQYFLITIQKDLG